MTKRKSGEEEGKDYLDHDIQREDIELNPRNVLYDTKNLGYIWYKTQQRIYKTTGKINYHNEIGDDKVPKLEVCDENGRCKEIKACKCYGIIYLPTNFDYKKYVQHLK